MDHSLVHIIVPPVVSWCIVPLADQVFEGVFNVAVIEAGDKVGTANDILRVKEPKCALLVVGDELDMV